MEALLFGEQLRDKISLVQLENQKDIRWRVRALQAVGPVDALVKQDLLALDDATAYAMIEALMQGEIGNLLAQVAIAWRIILTPQRNLETIKQAMRHRYALLPLF